MKSLHILKSLSVPTVTSTGLLFTERDAEGRKMWGFAIIFRLVEQFGGEIWKFMSLGKWHNKLMHTTYGTSNMLSFVWKSSLTALFPLPLLLYSVQGCALPAIAANSTVLSVLCWVTCTHTSRPNHCPTVAEAGCALDEYLP